MIQLALDTSTEAFSVAVENNGEVFAHFEIAPRMHGEKLLPTVDRLIAQAGINRNDIQGIIYGKGPGAFTGVRIAVSAAQGLAFGFDCPLLGLSSLQNLAAQVFEARSENTVLCAMDARMGEVYFAVYQRSEEAIPTLVAEEVVSKPEALMSDSRFATCFERLNTTDEDWVGVGSGWNVYQSALLKLCSKQPNEIMTESLPNAKYYLAIAKSLPQNEFFTAEQAVPTYLRNNVAEKSKKPSILSAKKT